MRIRRVSHSVALMLSFAAAAAPQQFVAETAPPFTFTKIDLELLDKAGQLDRYFQDKGLVYNDPETSDYITAVGTAIVPGGALPEHVVWRFRVLRDPIPNAFALPNGSLYVTSGLLALLENEAQLASVLAHEQTHVLNRHGYLENRSHRKKALTAHIFAAAGAGGGIAGGMIGASVYLIGNLVPAFLEASVYGYARDLEREADLRSVGALNNAGYSTEEIPNVFRLLQTDHEVELSEFFYRDHPKLQERLHYVSALVNDTRPSTRHPKVEAEAYIAATEQVARHNVDLDILAGRARTAAAVALRLTRQNPGSSEDYCALGDAFRALGPRTPEPTPDELSSKGKKEARKNASKMTRQEQETALMATSAGKAAWEINRRQSEEAYRQAVELSAANGNAHRGLGFLYERAHQDAKSAEEFRKYLELSPDAPDRLQIVRHLEALEKTPSQQPPSPLQRQSQ
jgi:beta-barrel assembly-enhancing protease